MLPRDSAGVCGLGWGRGGGGRADEEARGGCGVWGSGTRDRFWGKGAWGGDGPKLPWGRERVPPDGGQVTGRLSSIWTLSIVFSLYGWGDRGPEEGPHVAGERQSPSFPAQCCPPLPQWLLWGPHPLSIHYLFQSCGLLELRQVGTWGPRKSVFP